MKLYNTRTKQIDEFAPLDGRTARIYSCGPTVYNHAHIGNLSAYVASDILHRALKLANFEVKRVMNFTDVDDKTVRDSKIEHPDLPPMEALAKTTRRWEKVFLDDMAAIGNDTNEIQFKRATENIDDMIKLTKHLLEQGVAYTADDGVYFNIAEYQKTRTYGQLSHIDAPSTSRARIDNDEYDKNSAQDFALWKVEKPDEPAWDFAIEGQNLRGRPGWHIECSAMSVKYLGQPFDIHTGGVDHIFPHHENEIAQSTAGDQPELYAKFFVHNEHLLVDGKKMAKSANNFYTLPDIIKKGFSPLDFRMLVLQSHYRSATNFSWENLEAARNRLKNWRNVAELRHQIDLNDDNQKSNSGFINYSDLIVEAVSNDLDTPKVLERIDMAFGEAYKNPDVQAINHADLTRLLETIDKLLGINLLDATPDITADQQNLIKLRATAREQKNWAKSDEIRDQLDKQGLELNDTAGQTIWSRK